MGKIDFNSRERNGVGRASKSRERKRAIFAPSRIAGARLSAWKSWLSSSFGSIVFHALLLLVLLALIQGSKSGSGANSGRETDEVGIVFSDSTQELVDVSDELEEDAQKRAEDSDPLTREDAATEDSARADLERLLPSNEIGASLSQEAQGFESSLAAQIQSGASSPSSGQNVGFGDVRGSGGKFVYVLDRSDSMGWRGGAPMRRAISDAVASVQSLDAKSGARQFQIFVYNHDVEVLGGAAKLLETSEVNKNLALRFLRSLVPTGGTEPAKALERALALKPDVAFFLTDADEELTEEELERVQALRKRYKVKQICVVEFGKSTDPKKKSFRRLAGENGGTYVFKDVEGF